MELQPITPFAQTAGEFPASSKAVKLYEKIENDIELTKEEKLWLTQKLRNNTFFNTVIPVMGWGVPFYPYVKQYLVVYDDGKEIYWAPDDSTVISLVKEDLKGSGIGFSIFKLEDAIYTSKH